MSAEAPALREPDWAVRAAVYAHFAATTLAPANADLAETTGLSEAEVEASLRRLEDAHHLALFPDRHEVWMANPFSAVPTAFPVRTAAGRYWANCAWDALGVPALLGVDGWIETVCAQSGAPLSFGVRGGEVAGDDGLVHLLVPVRDAWVDIGFT